MEFLGLSITRKPTKVQFPEPISRKISSSATSSTPQLPAVTGGRKTTETPNTVTGLEIFGTFTNRKRAASIGLQPTFDLADFANMDFDKLTDLLMDLSPEISKALWDALLMANSGYECKAYKADAQEGAAIDPVAQAAVDAILETLSVYYGTTGVFFDRTFKTLVSRGAFIYELVLAKNKRDFVDIASPDPATLVFKRVIDPTRGQTWAYGQYQNGVFVDLTGIPTIKYVPLHPGANSIEGHGIFTPAFFSAIFLMSVLRDMKRVVEQQGYPRLDVEIQFKEMLSTMPAGEALDPKEVETWMQQTTDKVVNVYNSLKPDDTYVHSDTIKVNKPVGAISSDALKAIDALFQGLERMLTRGCKSMPILMATTQTRGQTQSNREWDIYSLGIENLQHLVEAALEHILTLALQCQGIAARIKFRFAQYRTSELLRDTQADLLKTTVAKLRYDCGYISQDEAAQYACGREKADSEEPRVAANIQDINATEGHLNTALENPTPSETKSVALKHIQLTQDARLVRNEDGSSSLVYIDGTRIPFQADTVYYYTGKEEEGQEDEEGG